MTFPRTLGIESDASNRRPPMKHSEFSILPPSEISLRSALFFRAGILVSFIVILYCQRRVIAQSDNFDDGNDTGWIRYSALTIVGAPVTFSFPTDDLGGKAYRFQCPAPSVDAAGPARALSYPSNIRSDFFTAVDLAGFDKDLNQAFGYVFRGETIGLGTTTGYILNYDTQQSSGGRGQLQINRVVGERDNGTIGAANVTLDPNRRYRLVLTASGADFEARIYDLADLTSPLASFPANDSTYSQGIVGLFNYSRFTPVTDKSAGRADTTFDNYLTAEKAPSSVPSPGTPHGVVGMPQVVIRLPMSRANFYPAASGVSFTATTLTTNTIKTTRMFLNDVDVSAKLVASGSSSNLSVVFKELSSNTVYDGRIVLEDFAGRKSTNEWTFDTFSEDFLNSPQVKVIEAEDYNYDGGKFQDNPPVSGLTSGGVPVNGSGVGYYDLAGIPEVDFHDLSTVPGSGATPEFRTADFVGTQAGSAESGASGQDNPPQNDTRRQKYAARDLAEYEVRRTEGGEWLNYTRNFTAGNYNVYLRVGARSPQDVLLDRVTGDRTQPNQTTSSIGAFHVQNTGLIVNYRYVPLTDASGKLAAANLSGLQTLRLTLGGPQQDSTQNTMTINYLLFVPASAAPSEIQLESATSVNGPYSADSSAVIDLPSQTFTVPINSASRFFRLRANSVLPKIQGTQIANGTLMIKYAGIQ